MADEEGNESGTGVQETQGDSMPDWARKKLSDANAEAARYRTEKKDAVEAAKQEVTDSFQEKIQEYESTITEREKAIEDTKLEGLKLAAAVNVLAPSKKIQDFAELLQGNTEDELASHADKLVELFGTSDTQQSTKATDKSQGQGNNSTALNGDGILNAVLKTLK